MLVQLDHNVPRRNPSALKVLFVQDGFDGDVFAAGHPAKARARDPLALIVEIPWGMAVDRCNHGHIGFIEVGHFLAAVTDPGVVLAGDFPVHVDADQDRAARAQGHSKGVIEIPLPGDQAGFGPVFSGWGGPHFLARDVAVRILDLPLTYRAGCSP